MAPIGLAFVFDWVRFCSDCLTWFASFVDGFAAKSNLDSAYWEAWRTCWAACLAIRWAFDLWGAIAVAAAEEGQVDWSEFAHPRCSEQFEAAAEQIVDYRQAAAVVVVLAVLI